MDYLQRFIEAARLNPRRLVLPESADERVVEAANRLERQGLAAPILLPVKAPQSAVAPDRLAGYAEALAKRRSGQTVDEAMLQLADPLMLAGAMVAAGDADAMIAGAAHPTKDVIRAGLRTVGLAPGVDLASSFFLIVARDEVGRAARRLIFADCAVNIDPNPQELAAIAIASARSAESLLQEDARVALLSFSTHGSASHPAVDKIVEALAIVRQSAPGLRIDGELQADAALSMAVARKKVGSASTVAGQANVLVFPSLEAGNIAYKLVQQIAGAAAVGPFLQGMNRPVCDLSRGTSVDEIVAAAVITSAQVRD